MNLKLALVLITTFYLAVASPQDSTNILQIEKTVTAIDSTIAVRSNIGVYIYPMFSDDGGSVFLKHHYFIDTTKRILYKAVYEYIDFEQVSFYYSNQKIIKVVISYTTANGSAGKYEYYSDNDSIISTTHSGEPDLKYSWNDQKIISKAKEYLMDFSSICNMLDKRK